MTTPLVRWKLEELDLKDFKLEGVDVDEGDGGPLPEAIAMFEPVNKRYGKSNKDPFNDGADWFYSDHVRADGYSRMTGVQNTTYVLPILLDTPSPQDGSVAFTITGTAVAGTHYTLSTPSPITVNEDANQVLLTLEILDPGVFFDEKSLIITLTSGTNVTLAAHKEYRLWLYPVKDAPSLSFNATTDSGGAGTYRPRINLDEVSGSDANIYYTVTTTGGLTSPTHYTVTASGTPNIAAGDTATTETNSTGPAIAVTAAGATLGGTIALELDHEPEDRTAENKWTNTHTWKHEKYGFTYEGDDSSGSQIIRGFPGEPSTHGAGGGQWFDLDGDGDEDEPRPLAEGNLVIGLDETTHPETGLNFWTIPAANQKTKPNGDVMQAILMHQGAERNFYIRESFFGETYCGLKAASEAIGEYNLVSVYVDTIPAPETSRNSQFVRLTQRNREKDIENSVYFWRLSDGNDAAGNPSRLYSGGGLKQFQQTNTGTWGLWFTKNMHPLSRWGVEEESIDGTLYTRLWMAHYVPPGGHWCAQNNNRRGESTITAASGSGTILTDSSATFTANPAVQVNDVVVNLADFSHARVLSVDSDTQLTLTGLGGAGGLGGGYDDGFEVGDEYVIKRNQSNGVDTEQVQGDLQNVLMRFTYYGSDAYGSRTQSSGNFENGNGRGKGLCAWGPCYLNSSSDLLVSNAPTGYAPSDVDGVGRYWEKAGNWPRPRGLAYADTTNQVYTLTVS